MDIQKKIKLAESYAGISESELARRLGVSPQALGQKIKRSKFSGDEIERLGNALGAQIEFRIKFPDGMEF